MADEQPNRKISDNLKYAFYILFFYVFPLKGVAQELVQAKPVVEIAIIDSQLNKIKYALTSAGGISMNERPVIAPNCDDWFIDIVINLEKYDEYSNYYMQLPCNTDNQPMVRPDVTIEKPVLLNGGKSEDFFVYFDRHNGSPGIYRVKIKFYYYKGEVRSFSESGYVYISVR